MSTMAQFGAFILVAIVVFGALVVLFLAICVVQGLYEKALKKFKGVEILSIRKQKECFLIECKNADAKDVVYCLCDLCITNGISRENLIRAIEIAEKHMKEEAKQ